MRRAVGIGRASVRSWSGEGIGSVFVGTAAPGTVTQQRRHQASTGGEPIRSRAQFALLTRAWATGRPVSRPDDDDSQLQAEPVKEPLGGASGEEARDGPDDQESRKEIKWKKSKPCQRSKPCHDADKARNHNEEKRRRHEARRAVACKETTAREGGSALKEKWMGHFVPGAGAARLSLRGVAVRGGRGRGRVGQELRPPNGRAVLEGGIHKLRRDRVGRRRRWRLDAKVKLFWLAFVVLDRKLRHGPLCDSPSRALGQSSNGRSWVRSWPISDRRVVEGLSSTQGTPRSRFDVLG